MSAVQRTLLRYTAAGIFLLAAISKSLDFHGFINSVSRLGWFPTGGFDLFSRRLDKGYSLADCISMNAVREEGIAAILTNDHHFTQEGFQILITR